MLDCIALFKTGQIISKYYHSYRTRMTTEQLSVLLYLNVACLPQLVELLIQATFKSQMNLCCDTVVQPSNYISVKSIKDKVQQIKWQESALAELNRYQIG